jgi:hypothetical protein
MSLQVNLSGVVNNGLTFTGQVVNNGTPLDLTSYTMVAIIKSARTASDSAGTSFTPSKTNATLGQFSWTIPPANNASAGAFWYRIDIVSGASVPYTVFMGAFNVQSA